MRRFGPRRGLIGFALIVIAAAVVVADFATRWGPVAGLRAFAWAALAVWALALGTVALSLHADERQVIVRNGLRRWRIPWSAVADIRMRHQVEFVLRDGRRVTALGGPDQVRPSLPSFIRGRGGGDRRVPLARDTDALLALLEASADESAGPAQVEVRWSIPLIAVGAAALVGALLALIPG